MLRRRHRDSIRFDSVIKEEVREIRQGKNRRESRGFREAIMEGLLCCQGKGSELDEQEHETSRTLEILVEPSRYACGR